MNNTMDNKYRELSPNEALRQVDRDNWLLQQTKELQRANDLKERELKLADEQRIRDAIDRRDREYDEAIARHKEKVRQLDLKKQNELLKEQIYIESLNPQEKEEYFRKKKVEQEEYNKLYGDYMDAYNTYLTLFEGKIAPLSSNATKYEGIANWFGSFYIWAGSVFLFSILAIAFGYSMPKYSYIMNIGIWVFAVTFVISAICIFIRNGYTAISNSMRKEYLNYDEANRKLGSKNFYFENEYKQVTQPDITMVRLESLRIAEAKSKNIKRNYGPIKEKRW